MNSNVNKKEQPTVTKAWNFATKAVVISAIVWLVYYLRNVLVPFAVAFLLAYLLNPVVNLFQKKVKKRILAVALTLISVVIVFSTLIIIFTPIVLKQTNHLSELLKNMAIENNWQAKMSDLPSFVSQYIHQTIQNQYLENIIKNENIIESAKNIVSYLMPQITNFFSETINIIIGIIGFLIVILYLIFIMIDYETINEQWYKLIPQKYKSKVLNFFARFEIEMHRYFRGQIIVASIVSICYSIGFSAIGLPMAILLGLFIGVLNLIPYLQVVGFLPAAGLAIIMSFEKNIPIWQTIALTAMVFVVVQIFQDLIITPKIMGKKTGLNPAIILLSLSVWGKIFGFLGLLLALPFTCIVKTYYSEYINTQNSKENNNTINLDVKMPAPNLNGMQRKNPIEELRNNRKK